MVKCSNIFSEVALSQKLHCNEITLYKHRIATTQKNHLILSKNKYSTSLSDNSKQVP